METDKLAKKKNQKNLWFGARNEKLFWTLPSAVSGQISSHLWASLETVKCWA